MKATPSAIKIKITPRVATELLDKHEILVKQRGDEPLNRNINDNLVAKYAADMAGGKWLLNGETVKIATSGRILDGQHRLWAAAHHNVSFDSMVVSGLEEDAFYTIDIGRGRKPHDFLSVDGVKHAAVVAAAARLIIGYRRGNLKGNHMLSTPDILAFARANARLVESASAAYGAYAVVAPSVGAAWHFLFSESDREGADKFIEDLKNGVGLNKGDPVLALRERLIKNKSSKAKLTSRDIFVVGIRAWNDRRGGRTRAITKVMTDAAGEIKLPKVA